MTNVRLCGLLTLLCFVMINEVNGVIYTLVVKVYTIIFCPERELRLWQILSARLVCPLSCALLCCIQTENGVQEPHNQRKLVPVCRKESCEILGQRYIQVWPTQCKLWFPYNTVTWWLSIFIPISFGFNVFFPILQENVSYDLNLICSFSIAIMCSWNVLY